jgi:hypothetical protein
LIIANVLSQERYDLQTKLKVFFRPLERLEEITLRPPNCRHTRTKTMSSLSN